MSDHSEFMRTANERRLESFRKNSRLIKGVRWLGTLDAHCCVICGALDEAEWDLEGKPLGDHGFHFHTPPLHPDCRCVLSPVPKSFRDLGIDIDEPDEGQRSSCNGPIAGRTTFQDFLRQQSPEFVERMLGSERAELFLSGKLALGDFVTPDCRERTIGELHRMLAKKP